MKSEIRVWSNEQQSNRFIPVEVHESGSVLSVSLHGITLTDGHQTIQSALDAAEAIIRERRLS